MDALNIEQGAVLSAGQLSILLVEPSDMQRRLIAQYLQEEGISQLLTAASVAEAAESVRRYQPDLVISALYFADGTGFDLLNDIRHDDALSAIPFMLVSSETRREQLEAFKQAGVVAILPKPFTHQHLMRALSATIDLLENEELELELYDPQELRVLLVDDSKLSRNYLRRMLSNFGIEHITEAENGRSAIEQLTANQFDIVVTDYNMPEVNGRELTEFIRHDESHQHVPVLMVSSDAEQLRLSNIEHSGINALCDKPMEPGIFKQLLNNLLEN